MRHIDQRRYPIHEPESAAYASLVADCRAAFRESGVALLPNFLTKTAQHAMVQEAVDLVARAFFCRNEHNVYLDSTDPNVTPSHPRNQLLSTNVGSIANDYLGAHGPLQELYHWTPLTNFIAAVVEVDELFVSADPLGAVSINVFAPGDAHAWHFDESRFSVTLMLQTAESGGHFEYVRGLREQVDDGNVGAIGDLLAGHEASVDRLPFAPGTLSIFAGRHTIHRVTEVRGDLPRLVPVLTYADAPGYRNSDHVREFFWGRTG